MIPNHDLAPVLSFTVVCQLGKCPTRGAGARAGAGGGGATSRVQRLDLTLLLRARTLRENGDTLANCFYGVLNVCRRLMKGPVWRQNSCLTVVNKFIGITVNQWLILNPHEYFFFTFINSFQMTLIFPKTKLEKWYTSYTFYFFSLFSFQESCKQELATDLGFQVDCSVRNSWTFEEDTIN